MDDLLMVHVGYALQDLLHEAHARALRQHELVLNHPVEQLSATDAGNVISTYHDHGDIFSYCKTEIYKETRAALYRGLL